MSRKYSLASIREVWLDAYLNGDASWLEYLEAPCFVVVNGPTLVSKAEQIAYLERSRQKFPGGRNGDFSFTQSVHRTLERESWATVVGSFVSSRNGRQISNCDFSEFWISTEGSWRITSLYLRDKSGAAEK
jgi:hypothetical protein